MPPVYMMYGRPRPMRWRSASSASAVIGRGAKMSSTADEMLTTCSDGSCSASVASSRA